MANSVNLVITDPQTIIDDAIKGIDTFNGARARLNQSSIKFTDAIDKLNINNLKDGTILRERMKLAVIKSSTHLEL